MSDASIGIASGADLPGIARVDDAFRRDGAAEWSLMSAATFETLIASRMVLVASVGDEIVGYLAWSLLWGFPFISYVRIVAEHRSRGIGSEMLRAMVEDVRARGYAMIWSSTQDARALRWHERNGFSRVGTTEWIWGNMPETFLMKEL